MVKTSSEIGGNSMPGITSPRVSVIIPSHRNEYIDELVISFTKEVCGSVSIEIIVVADYAVDRYKDKYTHITWIYIPDKSISVKRNTGILSAHSDICAFIDDDCIPQKDWIPSALTYLNCHPEIAGVEGLTEICSSDEKKGAYREFKRLENRGFRTNNIFYRKKTLFDVAMFDERFSVQREDVDLAYTILESGLTIGYSQNVQVTHRYRKHEKWDLLKNCVNRRFDPLLFQKHEKLYRYYIKTPYPPGILTLFFIHCMAIAWYKIVRKYFFIGMVIDIAAIFCLTLRRMGIPVVKNSSQWIREYISFAVSPIVLTVALLYGAIRFQKFSMLQLFSQRDHIFTFFSKHNKR